ncbi:MAG: pantetheine-phosphate adenylyltransferase [Anaerolineales bacterium]
MKTAVYPGTFDPVHNGHIDIARRAADIFDRVIVAVYDLPQKTLLFSTQERVALVSTVLADVPNIEVESYSGLTADYCRRRGVNVIVRGLRVVSDFEREYQMSLTTRELAPEIDMICLMTSLQYAFLSSTIVKEIATAGGSVSQFVPAPVEAALRVRLQQPA